MAIEKWQPFSELMSLRQAMDRLFEESFVRPSRTLETLGEVAAPALDVYQTPSEIVVKAALPGVKPEDVNIDITGDTVTVKGGAKQNRKSREKITCIRKDAMELFPEAWSFPMGLSQIRLRQLWRMAF